VVEYPKYTTSDISVTTCEMVAVVHRGPCWQHLACCSVNSRHIGSEPRLQLHSTPLLGGFPSEYHHPVWCRQTRMVWLYEGAKSLFVLTWSTNVTDRQTPHDDIGRAYASHSAAKRILKNYEYRAVPPPKSLSNGQSKSLPCPSYPSNLTNNAIAKFSLINWNYNID